MKRVRSDFKLFTGANRLISLERKHGSDAALVGAIGRYFRISMTCVVYGVMLFEFFNYSLNFEHNNESLWVLLVAQSIRLFFYPKVGTLTTTLGVVFYTLYLFPTTALIIFDKIIPLQSVAAFIVSYDFLRIFGRTRVGNPANWDAIFSGRSVYLLFAILGWMLLSPFVLNSGLLTLVAPLSISGVLLELMLRVDGRSRLIAFALFSYALVFVSYLALHWSGFGRLVVGSYIIYIVLIVMHYYDLRFRLWLVPLLLPPALYFAQLSRYGAVEDLRTLLVGSAGHHLIVTEDARQLAEQGYWRGLAEFWDQLLLFFLGWFPRALWEGKPLGSGLASVDEIYGREGVSAAHSISLGFLGEQYYLLGDFAFLGLALMLVIILLVRKTIIRLARGLVAPVAAFDVSLMSFFWGSMSTFGNRVWFLVIPSLLFLFISRLRIQK